MSEVSRRERATFAEMSTLEKVACFLIGAVLVPAFFIGVLFMCWLLAGMPI